MRERAINYGLLTGGTLGTATGFLQLAPGGGLAALIFAIGALVTAGLFLREVVARQTAELLAGTAPR